MALDVTLYLQILYSGIIVRAPLLRSKVLYVVVVVVCVLYKLPNGESGEK